MVVVNGRKWVFLNLSLIFILRFRFHPFLLFALRGYLWRFTYFNSLAHELQIQRNNQRIEVITACIQKLGSGDTMIIRRDCECMLSQYSAWPNVLREWTQIQHLPERKHQIILL